MIQILPTNTVYWKNFECNKRRIQSVLSDKKRDGGIPLHFSHLQADMWQNMCNSTPLCVQFTKDIIFKIELECSIQQLAPRTMFLFSLSTPLAKTYHKFLWNEQGYCVEENSLSWHSNLAPKHWLHQQEWKTKPQCKKTIQTFSLQIQVTHPLNLSIRTENS